MGKPSGGEPGQAEAGLLPLLACGSRLWHACPMTEEELEGRLQGAQETQRLEFKGACCWNVSTFAKDILAIANVLDGGEILVGIEDQTFKRQGLSPGQVDSFRVETMLDQMSRFADPHVRFSVELATDATGLDFVLIRIYQFDEIPVLCRVDDKPAGTRAGTLYYRNRNRRPESAPVSNSYDMREIIESAAVRMMQRMTRIGATVKAEATNRLDEELEGL